MKFIETLKYLSASALTLLSAFLGGMDGVMFALLVFLSLDYVTGVAVAVKQKKLSSEVGFWGLVRKVFIIALVGVANMVDRQVMGTGDVFRTAVAIYYIGNEGISLLENISCMGVKLPPQLVAVLEQLAKDKDDKKDGEK